MEQQPTHDCGGGEIACGTVRSIVDGRTFVLEDGREVRLAAIEVPPAPQNAGQAPDGKATAAALNALAAAIKLFSAAPIAADRYGRLIAYAYAMRDGDALFVQGGARRGRLCPRRRPGRARLRRGTFEP